MRKICVVAFVCLAVALSLAQVNYSPMPVPRMQFFDSNGIPLAGGNVCTYIAGTSTPLATYTDYTGAVQNSACVTLDSAGRATIFLGAATYKFVVNNSSNVQQWTVDGVASIGGVLASPPAIGSVTPGPISGTTILATVAFNGTGAIPYQVNGFALNFTNLAGWPGSGIPNSTGSAWGTSYGTNGSGTVLVLATSPTLVTPNIGIATATSIIGLTGAVTPNAAGGVPLGSALLPFSSIYIGGAATNNAQLTGTFTAARVHTLPDVSGGVVVETSSTATLTPGTNVASTVCQTASCTNIRGTILINGGTATTGIIAAVAWTATPTAYVCTVTQNGGPIYGIGNSVATTTGFNITSSLLSVSGQVVTVNYSCQP